MRCSGTVFPAPTLRALIDTLGTLGLSADALRQASGVDPNTLEDPQGLAPSDAWGEVWRAARASSSLDALPTRAGLALPVGAFGLVDYLVGSAETFAAGIETLIARFGGIATLFTFELDLSRGLLSIVGDGASPLDNAEFAVAVVVSRVRHFSGQQVQVLRVELTRPIEPRRPQETLLGVPVVYGATQPGLWFRPEQLSLPNPAANLGLYKTLETLAERLGFGPAGPHFGAAVRSRIRRALPSGQVDAAEIAEALGTSERTLYRRLGEAGSTFREVLDEVRAAEAERGLLEGRPVSEVALDVGYAEQSAFARAFRRWKGMTPSKWLQSQRAG